MYDFDMEDAEVITTLEQILNEVTKNLYAACNIQSEDLQKQYARQIVALNIAIQHMMTK